MNILAIIPARGGSKGLPGKNIKPLLGHPLIAYSIKAAQESKLITRIIVNTDSEKIAEIAKQYGAEIFIRPPELGMDETTDLEVFTQQLRVMQEKENYIPDYIVQLRPTAPIRLEGMIDTCIEKLIQSGADSIRGITESPITPYKMWVLNKNNDDAMEPLLQLQGVKEPFNQPRQKLPVIYWHVGTIDIMKATVITELHSMNGSKILPYIIDQKLAIDIDEVESFYKAEEIIQYTDCIKFSE